MQVYDVPMINGNKYEYLIWVAKKEKLQTGT